MSAPVDSRTRTIIAPFDCWRNDGADRIQREISSCYADHNFYFGIYDDPAPEPRPSAHLRRSRRARQLLGGGGPLQPHSAGGESASAATRAASWRAAHRAG